MKNIDYNTILNNLFEYYRDETNRDEEIQKYIDEVHTFVISNVEDAYTCCERIVKLMSNYAYIQAITSSFHPVEIMCTVLTYYDTLSDFYNKNAKQTGNWWYWRIGIPNLLLKSYIMLKGIGNTSMNAVSIWMSSSIKRLKTGLEKFLVPNTRTDMTYANLASVCRNVFVMGIIYEDEKLVNRALTDAVPAFAMVNKTKAKLANKMQQFLIKNKWFPANAWMTAGKEGLYEDGTFIQHTAVSYIGTYGIEMLEYAALIAKCGGELDADIVKVLPNWCDAFNHAIYDNQVLLAYCGRAIETVDTVGQAKLIRKYISELSDVCPNIPYNDEDTSWDLIQEDGCIAVDNKKNYRFVIKGASDKIARYEYFNGQNKNGFNQGNGMMFLYLKGDKQYINHSIAELDYHRLPGTTVDITKEPSDTTSEQPTFDYTKDDLKSMSFVRDAYNMCTMTNALCEKHWSFWGNFAHFTGKVYQTGENIQTIIDNRLGTDFHIEWLDEDGNYQPVYKGTSYFKTTSIRVMGVAEYRIDIDMKDFGVYVEYTDKGYIIYLKHNIYNQYGYSICPWF